jgi:hypothetical protein
MEKQSTPKKQPAKAKAPEMVKMERNGKTADVHPTMVEEYRKGGYEVAK